MFKRRLELHKALKADMKDSQRDGVSVKRLATEFEKSEQWVYSVMAGEIPITVKCAVQWVSITGGEHIKQYLGGALGFIPVPRPSESNATFFEIADQLKAQAKAVDTLMTIYRDGKVSEEEAKNLVPECAGAIDDLIAKCLGVKAKLRHDAEQALVKFPRAATLKDAQG